MDISLVVMFLHQFLVFWVLHLHLGQTPSGHLNFLRFYPNLVFLTFFPETQHTLQPCSTVPTSSSHQPHTCDC